MPNRRRLRKAWGSERGFTLVEVMTVIGIMGILAAVAISLWWPVIESRRVDAATNQLAADLRLAHSKATNRLAEQTVTLTAGNSEYTMTGGGTGDLDDDPDEDIVSVAADSTIVFKADGRAVTPAGTAPDPITVRETNNTANNHTVEINTTTSEIKVVP